LSGLKFPAGLNIYINYFVFPESEFHAFPVFPEIDVKILKNVVFGTIQDFQAFSRLKMICRIMEYAEVEVPRYATYRQFTRSL